MRPKTRARKAPKQERSRETVEVLVEATGQLIRGEGLRGVTTRRVAERAGVSVGSLYQYFPGRDALVAAYLDRRLEDDLMLLGRMLDELRGQPLDVVIGSVVRAFLRRHVEERELYGEIFEAVALAERTDEVGAAVAEMVRMLAQHLRERPEVRLRDPEAAAFAVVHALRGLMLAPAMGSPQAPSEEVVAERMTAMAIAALR